MFLVIFRSWECERIHLLQQASYFCSQTLQSKLCILHPLSYFVCVFKCSFLKLSNYFGSRIDGCLEQGVRANGNFQIPNEHLYRTLFCIIVWWTITINEKKFTSFLVNTENEQN